MRQIETRQFETPDSDQPDDALVARLQAGENQLFVVLMKRHNRSVYRVVRSVVREESAVEDVMQDAYISAFTHLQDLTGGGAFSTWLRKIAFHLALHWVRRVRSEPLSDGGNTEFEAPSPLLCPEREAGRIELRAALEQAVDALPDDFRDVFMLRSVDGCSVAETADVLGVREDAVKTRLFRARTRLQETLSSWSDLDAANFFAFPALRCGRVAAAVLERLPH
jgi:RNA polymerase sigma-70 factor, ECF subfamily